jgi:Kef-type K+ transport system membrane component KefB
MFEFLRQLTPPAEVRGAALTAYVLFDVFLIVVLARILGNLMVRIKQPRVVGEILAGILLGPTLLGQTLSEVIAPLPVRPILGAIATLGLILFMFLAGVEFELGRLQGRSKQAGLLALLSVVVPALLGFPVALGMHTAAYAGPAGASLVPFALFIGAALSVTAFPVMAHILMERGELNTPMGTLGVATTAIMSVFMFTYIAFAGAVAAAQGFGGLLQNIVFMIVLGLTAWFVARPLLARILPGMVQGNVISGTGMAIVFGGMLLFGLIAHLIGINALVGGFVWGVVLPNHPVLRQALAAKVRDVAMILVLPVFFALAGFSTDLKLLTVETLPALGVLLLGAIGGKFLGALPARVFGLSWNDTLTLGALFNTRGLLVLVAGLIGLDLQIITRLTFTLIVVVALVTNLMTLPLLNAFRKPAPVPNTGEEAIQRI